MPHEMAPPQPTPDELAKRLFEQHANTEIQFHGKTMPFGQFVQLREALCPVKPGELGAASDTEFMVNVLVDSKVELPEEYHPYIKQPESEKSEANTNTNDTDTKKTVTPKSEIDKTEVSVLAKSIAKNSSQEIYQTAARLLPKIHPEIMSRVVMLETKPETNKPLPKKAKSVTSKPVIEAVSSKPDIETIPKKVSVENKAVIESVITEPEAAENMNSSIAPLAELPGENPMVEQTEETSEIKTVETSLIVPEDYLHIPVDELKYVTDPIELEPGYLSDEITAPVSLEIELTELAEEIEAYEETEKTPAVAVAEFMLQVLPAATQEVYIRVQEMEPIAAAEVAAQVETISVVADRLHVLVLEGNTEGEEAKQIEAYLKREYEQLLVAVGIEPTEEILNEFIRYIYSAEYQIREDINLKELEVIEEGTHEKKLFDEQGVFSRAHAASLDLSRRLDKSIGRLVVNYFST